MPSTAQSAETQTLLLDAAEQVFADYGFGAASLRQIVRQAGVNLAAIHYHFGSKDALVEAVFGRRISHLAAERLALLRECEKEAGTKPLPLEKVLEAFVGPALRMAVEPGMGGRVFVRLYGRTISEPSDRLQGMLAGQFAETIKHFGAAMQRALPKLSPAELGWRFQFLVGSMAYLMADPQNLKSLSGGMCDPADTDRAVRELVAFLAAGLRAPSAQKR